MESCWQHDPKKLYEDGKLKTCLAVDPPPKVEEEKEPNLENSTLPIKLRTGASSSTVWIFANLCLEAEILRFPRCCWMPSFGPLLPRS